MNGSVTESSLAKRQMAKMILFLHTPYYVDSHIRNSYLNIMTGMTCVAGHVT